MRQIDIPAARRIALQAQGFGRPRLDREPTADDLMAVLDRLKLVQIDTVNVLTRAQYLPFYSRLGPYRPGLLDELAYDRRRLFEYWAHEACYVPIEHYRLFEFRRSSWPMGKQARELLDEHPGFLESVLAQVGARGPLAVGDLDEQGGAIEHAWHFSMARLVLLHHLGRGNLVVSHRVNFTRYHDLAERVVPPSVRHGPSLSTAASERRLLALAADAMGVGTAEDLADYYRLPNPRARPVVERMVEDGELEPVAVDGWRRPAYAIPGITVPPRVRARALLSPFDPLVWFRDRTERLWDFFYRLEIYVPRGKRRWGYYVLPFLMDERLVARVDLKADRARRVLRVPAAFAQAGEDVDEVAWQLARELEELAGWLDLDRVVVGRRGDLRAALRSALEP